MTSNDLTKIADLTRHGRGTGALRTRRPEYVDFLPPCNDACPAGENIQAWLALAQGGDFEGAWRELVRNNPMPSIHGRVCYHPCEDVCNRAITDSAISIHAVERFLGDLALEKGWQFHKPEKSTGKKILIVGVSLSLMFLLHRFIQKSKWGMAMRAMSFDFQAVPLMGISIDRIAPLTFAIGSALAAAAGILYGLAYPVLDPYMGILLGWKAFVAAILGGRGSILGAALAGFLLGFIEIFTAWVFPSTLRDVIAYTIILLILTLRPHGFFGEPYSARLRL